MSRIRYSVFAAMLMILLISFAGATSQRTAVVLTEKDLGKTVNLTVGSVIEVRLNSNASTGYSWVVKSFNGSVMQQSAPAQYVTGESSAPGTPGTQVFTFAAIAGGKTTLKFEYLPPGRKHKGTKTTIGFRFKIRK